MTPEEHSPAQEDLLPWSEWYDQHASRFFLFARQISRNRQDAEDVLQDALVRSMESAFPGRPDLPFVYRKIRHTAADFYRKQDRRTRREQEFAADQDLWFQNPEPDHQDCQKLISQLPSEQKEVVVLKIWGELSFREIGDALEISPATAASRYRIALEKLRQNPNSSMNHGS